MHFVRQATQEFEVQAGRSELIGATMAARKRAPIVWEEEKS